MWCSTSTAPPYGTARRARARKFSARRRASGTKAPRPLRSATHPHGLPSLEGVNLRCARTANIIYKNVCRIAAAAVSAGCLVSIENPTRSWMWETDYYFKELLALHRWQWVTFQQCMHGGRRPVWSSFLCSGNFLDDLASTCTNQHKHLPCGVSAKRFQTSEENEYPPLLCSRITQPVVAFAKQCGCQDLATQSKKRKQPDPASMAQAGKHPRGNRFPELIPEFLLTTLTMP